MKTLNHILVICTLLALLILNKYTGLEGFFNLYVFFTTAIFLVLTGFVGLLLWFLVMRDSKAAYNIIDDLAKHRNTRVIKWVSLLIGTLQLCLLVWWGHFEIATILLINLCHTEFINMLITSRKSSNLEEPEKDVTDT